MLLELKDTIADTQNLIELTKLLQFERYINNKICIQLQFTLKKTLVSISLKLYSLCFLGKICVFIISRHILKSISVLCGLHVCDLTIFKIKNV